MLHKAFFPPYWKQIPHLHEYEYEGRHIVWRWLQIAACAHEQTKAETDAHIWLLVIYV